MRTTIAALTFILVAGAAFASIPTAPAVTDPATAVAPADTPLPAMDEALPSQSQGLVCIGTLDALLSQEAPVRMASLCTRECRNAYVDCREVSPGPQCAEEFDICLSKC
jgi:hypothetical protein